MHQLLIVFHSLISLPYSNPLSVLSTNSTPSIKTSRIVRESRYFLIKNRDCSQMASGFVCAIPLRSAEKWVETWTGKCFRLIENDFSSFLLSVFLLPHISHHTSRTLKRMSQHQQQQLDLVHLSQFIFSAFASSARCFLLSSISRICFDCNLFSVWSSLSSW